MSEGEGVFRKNMFNNKRLWNRMTYYLNEIL